MGREQLHLKDNELLKKVPLLANIKENEKHSEKYNKTPNEEEVKTSLKEAAVTRTKFSVY